MATGQIRDRYGRWVDTGGLVKYTSGGVERTASVVAVDGGFVIINDGGQRRRVHQSRIVRVGERARLENGQ